MSHHEDVKQLALSFLQEKALSAVLETWIKVTAPNGMQQRIRVDVAGFEGGNLYAVVEVGSIGTWSLILSSLVEMYHWPVWRSAEKNVSSYPHHIGECTGCPLVNLPGYTYQVTGHLVTDTGRGKGGKQEEGVFEELATAQSLRRARDMMDKFARQGGVEWQVESRDGSTVYLRDNEEMSIENQGDRKFVVVLKKKG